MQITAARSTNAKRRFMLLPPQRERHVTHAIRYLPVLLLFIVACGNGQLPDNDPLIRFAHAYHERYPEAEVQDLYKTLFQEHFGPGHIIANRDAALEMLLSEIESMPDGESEEITEYCGPDAAMLRINLRPALRDGLTPDTIVSMMLESMREIHPDTLAFLEHWDHLLECSSQGRLPWKSDEFEHFEAGLDPSGVEVMHHSPRFMRNYSPAYRIVLTSVYEKHFGPISD